MPKSFLKYLSLDFLPYLIISFVALLQLSLIFLPSFNFLLLNFLPDDAFYYFNIARNINLGLDSTFDGVNLTNGYHPLWMLLILPIFKVFSLGNLVTNNFDVVPIYWVLSLSIVFFAFSAVILNIILKKFTDDALLRSAVLAISILNPYVLYSSLNGLETGMLLFVFLLFAYLLLNFDVAKANVKQSFVFGIVAGLLILSRLDMIFVVAIAYLYLMYKKQKFNLFMISTLTTAIIFFTWQIYNYLKFNMLLTTASVTITYVNHFLTYNDNGSNSWFVFLKTIVYMFDRAVIYFFNTTGAYLLVLPMVGVAIYLFAKDRDRALGPIWFLGLGLFVQFFTSASIRWAYRDWYFIPHLFIISFVLTYVLINLKNEFTNTKYFNYFVMGLTVCFIGFYYISWEKEVKNREIMQDTIMAAAVWQNQNLPPGSKIGVFNSGIAGYFSSHKVYNLDGQVNSAASKNMLSHTMWKYIKDEDLDYLADFPQYFTYRFKNFLGVDEANFYKQVELVHTVETNGNKINIYKIIK